MAGNAVRKSATSVCAAASPFSARVDRLAAEQRTDVSLRFAGGLPAGVGLEASATFRYVWDADPVRPGRRLGVEDLTVRAAASVPLGEAVVDIDLDLALAGLVDPRAGREAFVAARWTWSRDGTELGVRTTVGLEPDGTWRDLTLFAAVPIEPSPAWALRPYLAVDVLAFAGGAGPWLRGHGLDVAWRTCCGTVELGYRNDEADGATTHFAVSLPVRPLDPGQLNGRAATR